MTRKGVMCGQRKRFLMMTEISVRAVKSSKKAKCMSVRFLP